MREYVSHELNLDLGNLAQMRIKNRRRQIRKKISYLQLKALNFFFWYFTFLTECSKFSFSFSLCLFTLSSLNWMGAFIKNLAALSPLFHLLSAHQFTQFTHKATFVRGVCNWKNAATADDERAAKSAASSNAADFAATTQLPEWCVKDVVVHSCEWVSMQMKQTTRLIKEGESKRQNLVSQSVCLKVAAHKKITQYRDGKVTSGKWQERLGKRSQIKSEVDFFNLTLEHSE